MIGMFESMVRRCPQRTCFTYVDEAGEETAYSYRETRLLSAALARYLRDRGVRPGDYVAVDLPNCPAYVQLMLAAAYGGFTLVVLNNRLTESEKASRLMDVERATGAGIAVRINEANVERYVSKAMALLSGELVVRGGNLMQTRVSRTTFSSRASMAEAEPRSARGLGRASSSRAALRRRNEVARQDAIEGVIHFAEHAAHVFDREARAVVMFTSGTSGRAKAVTLNWENLCRSAEVSNAVLNRQGEGLWQAALPLYHVGGFQVIVRSFLNCCPFILYRRFDADRLVSDGARKGATHVSVVDKMLQDMIATGRGEALRRYGCILLGGGATNPSTIERARALRLRVFVSYGMTETSSQIANSLLTPSYAGGLRLLPGYHARIVDPGEDGFGRLAVRGPGLFRGYLNARAALTVDGYFLTGDTAALIDGLLYVKERTDDMFVSGGENVYPAEIREKLLRVPGVSDAYVFGARDALWGRRPIAFIERAPEPAAAPPTASDVSGRLREAPARSGDHEFAVFARESVASQLSKIYQPKHVHVLDAFPRSGIGKIDRAVLERLYEERIEVTRVALHRISVPFITPFETAKGTVSQRESIIVEVTDHAGRTGLGECVAFSTDWYLPETLDQDLCVLKDVLAPLVLNEALLHPGEASSLFTACAEAARHPMACGALEPALWDLYGKIVNKPLWQLVGEAFASPGSPTSVSAARAASVADVLASSVSPSSALDASISVPAGAVVGAGSPSETAAAVRRCAEAGYARVKLKIKPGTAVACVRAAQAAAPNALITLDANQSFTERDTDELRALDACGAAWIEEPLDPRRIPAGAPTDLFARLARLQRSMRTPLCIDESVARPRDVMRALAHAELRCYSVKIGKFGGIQPSIDFVRLAQSRGIDVWMGGMYDTGVSKRMHAAFETLPGVNAPGDIGATSRYFATDVTAPPYTVERGLVTLNREGDPSGLGCSLDRAALSSVLVDRTVIDRSSGAARTSFAS